MVFHRSLLLFFVVAMIMATGAEGQAPPVQASNRAVPDDNLAYPVRVYLKGSQGSGFFLATDEALYFATAKHVLYNVRGNGSLFDNDLTLESYSADVNEAQSNLLAVDLAAVTVAGALKSHPTTDAAIIKIGKIEAGRFHAGPGVTIKQLAPTGIVGASIRDTTRKFAQVQISNDVYVFGYPNSIGLQQIPQIDQTRPLIRKGIVAGVNRKLRTIILDCEVYPGNSGGVVLEVENAGFQRFYRVIGLVSEYVPFDNARFGIAANPTVLNSGYSVVVPIDFVLELIEKT